MANDDSIAAVDGLFIPLIALALTWAVFVAVTTEKRNPTFTLGGDLT
ncbi:hypothetical protein RESH_00359 [Rhodopirellula europaea SH398]|uniref:Uncharacterized protein n=1 Tax=Rhodopirellula europaea SH398 TaxID=1263868 RepID=M5SC12_9BACT|nr:hypothetical protein RESH_00359 [Rhodopirellula europaea SH398]